jgi:hypothetical protein
MDAWRKEMRVMQERTDANLTERNAESRANNKMFEVLQGTLVFRMDIHQARTRVTVAEAEDSSGTQRKGNVRRWKPLPEDW